MRAPLPAPIPSRLAPSTAQMSDGETAAASTTATRPGAGCGVHPDPLSCMVKDRRRLALSLKPNAHTSRLPSTRTRSMTTLRNRRPTSLPPVQADPVRCSQHGAPCKRDVQRPKAQTFAADVEPTVRNSCWRPSALRTDDGSAICAHLVPFQRSIRTFRELVPYPPTPQASPG